MAVQLTSLSHPRPGRTFAMPWMLPVLLAAIPFAYLLRMCLTDCVDVPVSDAWGLVPRLDRLYAGTLTLHDVWAQHNEHRSLIPIVVLLALARLSDWNTNWEIVANVAAGVAIFAVFCAYLRTAWRAHGGAPLALVPLLSVLLFSRVQWENWLRGWQLSLLLCVLASLLTAYRMAQRDAGGHLAGAIAGAVCATYSFASGLFVWPVQALRIGLARTPHRGARLALWCGAGAITWASYFYHFRRPDQPPLLSQLTSLQGMRDFILFVLAYLGTPIGAYDPRASIAFGTFALVAFTALVCRLRHLRDDPAFLFPVLVGVQVILTSIPTAMSRAWMGLDMASSSRYTTFSLQLWCGIACLAVLWRRTAPRRAHAPAVTAMTVSLLLATLGSAVLAARPAAREAAGTAERLRYFRRGLITGKSDALLEGLFPSPAYVRTQRSVLRRLHLSVFRASIQPTFPSPGDQ